MLKTKPNCKEGNIACGKKCQPRHYNCKDNKEPEVISKVEKFVSAIEKSKSSSKLDINKANLILSQETKKQKRAEISKSPKKKELLAKIRREEAIAYTFLRLTKIKDKILKKNKGKETDTSKEISNHLSNLEKGNDDKKINEAINFKMAKKIESSVAKTLDDITETIETTKKVKPKKSNPLVKNLISVIEENVDLRSTSKQDKQDKLLQSIYKDFIQTRMRADKAISKGLSKEEAIGLSNWLGQSYKSINEAIYDPKKLESKYEAEFAEASAIRATQGLKKLPSYTHEELSKLAKKVGDKINKPGILRRGIQVSNDDLDAFLKPYEEALNSGKLHTEEIFFATSASKKIHFVDLAQVNYEIKAKSDGTGQGKLVDEFKIIYEAEVLFPPMSKFKITEIIRGDGSLINKTIIRMEEV